MQDLIRESYHLEKADLLHLTFHGIQAMARNFLSVLLDLIMMMVLHSRSHLTLENKNKHHHHFRKKEEEERTVST